MWRALNWLNWKRKIAKRLKRLSANYSLGWHVMFLRNLYVLALSGNNIVIFYLSFLLWNKDSIIWSFIFLILALQAFFLDRLLTRLRLFLMRRFLVLFFYDCFFYNLLRQKSLIPTLIHQGLLFNLWPFILKIINLWRDNRMIILDLLTGLSFLELLIRLSYIFLLWLILNILRLLLINVVNKFFEFTNSTRRATLTLFISNLGESWLLFELKSSCCSLIP